LIHKPLDCDDAFVLVILPHAARVRRANVDAVRRPAVQSYLCFGNAMAFGSLLL
jgi:hypothetical protein